MRFLSATVGLLLAIPGAAGSAEDQVELLERAIEYELDVTEGRALAPPRGSADLFQPGRQLRITGRRLDTLKTLAPQNEAIPLFERQLDRLQRPLSTGRPPPVQRDPLPPRRGIADFRLR
jgi:hypothetical protein